MLWIKTDSTEQNRTECLRAQWVPLPVKFLAIANELSQRKTQPKCYKNILLTENWYKIS